MTSIVVMRPALTAKDNAIASRPRGATINEGLPAIETSSAMRADLVLWSASRETRGVAVTSVENHGNASVWHRSPPAPC